MGDLPATPVNSRAKGSIADGYMTSPRTRVCNSTIFTFKAWSESRIATSSAF